MTERPRITCILCGGDGTVSEETARLFGGHPGHGEECPSCRGKGWVLSDPVRFVPPPPKEAKAPC